MKKTTALLLLILSMQVTAKPTLQETMEYLNEKKNSVMAFRHDAECRSWTDSISMSGAILKVVNIYHCSSSGYKETITYTTDLKKVDAELYDIDRHSNGFYVAKIFCRHGKECTKGRKVWSDSPSKTFHYDNFNVKVIDYENAERVAKAFLHLASLKGAKAELF